MDNLPIEILLHICEYAVHNARFRVRTFNRFRSVCSSWYEASTLHQLHKMINKVIRLNNTHDIIAYRKDISYIFKILGKKLADQYNIQIIEEINTILHEFDIDITNINIEFNKALGNHRADLFIRLPTYRLTIIGPNVYVVPCFDAYDNYGVKIRSYELHGCSKDIPSIRPDHLQWMSDNLYKAFKRIADTYSIYKGKIQSSINESIKYE
jgi:hypothetical protein